MKAPLRELSSRVYALDLSGDAWLASTAGGLFTSKDKGATWQGGPARWRGRLPLGGGSWSRSWSRRGRTGVVLSNDAGQTWWPMGIPTALTRIHRVAFSNDGTLWVGAREGVYFTRDKGKTWMWVHRLPLVGVDDLFYDAAGNRVLVSSRGSDFVYAIDAKSLDWKWLQTGFTFSLVRVGGKPFAGGFAGRRRC